MKNGSRSLNSSVAALQILLRISCTKDIGQVSRDLDDEKEDMTDMNIRFKTWLPG
jgi:hypothetical protein